MQKKLNDEMMNRLIEIYQEHLDLTIQIHELIKKRERLSNERKAIFRHVSREVRQVLFNLDIDSLQKAVEKYDHENNA